MTGHEIMMKLQLKQKQPVSLATEATVCMQSAHAEVKDLVLIPMVFTSKSQD